MSLEKAMFLLGNDERMEVQFNPTSYSISCPKRVERLYQDLIYTRGIVSGARDEARVLKLEISLYSYGFENEEINNSLGSQIVGIVKKNVKNVLGRGEKNVKESVENFYELIEKSQKEEYNGITFAWGDMIFHGLVQNLDLNYTMFSSGGEPIRAVASLQMVETPDPADFTGFGMLDQLQNAILSYISGETNISNQLGGAVDKLSGILPW